MKPFLLRQDRSTPPSSLPPSMHSTWSHVAKHWPLDEPWSVEAAIAEVLKRRAMERQTLNPEESTMK